MIYGFLWSAFWLGLCLGLVRGRKHGAEYGRLRLASQFARLVEAGHLELQVKPGPEHAAAVGEVLGDIFEVVKTNRSASAAAEERVH